MTEKLKAETDPMNATPYIVIAGPGSRELRGGYAYHYETARRAAAGLHGIITTAAWYQRHFGVDPLARLDAMDAPVLMGRPACRRRRAA